MLREDVSFHQLWEALRMLVEAHDALPLDQFGGCWTVDLDDHWKVKMNGHGEPKDNVPPHSVCVEFDGWPFAIIDAHGAEMAQGELANIQSFRAALIEAARVAS